ncbi:putative diguanylate cyclase AdrA [Boseongicola aestuarii]|uniref:diguanylate cyclase n=1 Tax=Boseongicola aestuarii TaxID=1470561 RepID=A0A238IVX2_9RHOB|nr:putative diguanylate cyclase AdrA [Boseongicola aestuarii]
MRPEKYLDRILTFVTPKDGINFLSKAVLVNAAVVLAFFQIEILVHDADTHHAAEHVLATLILSVPFSLIALAAIWYLNTLRRDLAKLAATDLLTGLSNRRAFMSASENATSQSRGIMMMIDLDHFKQINDTYGHTVGDDCLRAMADVLREQVRTNDVVGRLGGEEFGVFLVDAPMEAAQQIGERICAGASLTLSQADRDVKVTASIGAVEMPQFEDIEAMLTLADMAMYQAKNAGRGCLVFWEKGVTARAQAECV